jgi:3-isopropylmalate dehydrogenase
MPKQHSEAKALPQKSKQQSSLLVSRDSENMLLNFLGKDSSPGTSGTSVRPLLGVIEGCGIGPEVIAASLQVLAAVGRVTGIKFEVENGGLVGEKAEAKYKNALPDCTTQFFGEIFDKGGAVLSGPGGGRYVYDLRRKFDLYCKFVPVLPHPQLARSTQIAAENLGHVDMLIVRDNIGGVYQGEWQTHETSSGRVATHAFSYNENEIRRLAEVAARAAKKRRGKMHVIIKDAGVPAISELWREVTGEVASRHGIEAKYLNIDLASYEIVRNPSIFDVMLTPNLFGDILVDITGVLLGSRGVTFSGNYNGKGNAVYQTNHGCAHDLAGADVANPAGQLLSLAMLLRESFGMAEGAALIENALAAAWNQGCRTADIAEPGCKVLGTKAMTDAVVEQVFQLSSVKQPA